jgi:7-carboxy-7-deazaguanine synthase
VLQQVLTSQEKARADVLRVNEIFFSIQGEGSRAGEPCVFVRLTGCGLRCNYCDTEYAFYEGEDSSIGKVLETVRTYGCKLVEITGGEPLEQEGVYGLIDRLLDEDYDVMIETGGHMDISRVPIQVKRIVDLKTPGSEMANRNYYENVKHLTMHDEVKFVICDRADYEWAKEKVELFELKSKVGIILFSPVHGKLTLTQLAEWILQDKLQVKLQTQLHKLIWPDIERGV